MYDFCTLESGVAPLHSHCSKSKVPVLNTVSGAASGEVLGRHW